MNQDEDQVPAGIYEHALIAVLYAAQKEGVNLEGFWRTPGTTPPAIPAYARTQRTWMASCEPSSAPSTM